MGKQHLSRDDRIFMRGKLQGTRENMDMVAMVLMDKCGWHVQEETEDSRYTSCLEKLAEADKDGRVVVPPCKVGDRLYEVTGRKTISVYKVKAIRVELFGLFIEWDIVEGFVWQSLSGINAGEIGKTVFLTREEAEKALEATMNTFCRIIAPDVGREWPEGRSDGRAQAQPHGHRREERRTAAEEEADGHGGEPGVGVRMDAEAHAVGHYGTGDKEEL